MPDKPIVPEHEHEVFEAGKRQWHGDGDKVATTSLSSMIVEGVTVSSRYQKAGELRAMVAMVEALPPRLSAMVESIFCDSKLGYQFTVEMHRWSEGFAREIAERMDQACMSVSQGHSGIIVRHGKDDIEICGGADSDEV